MVGRDSCWFCGLLVCLLFVYVFLGAAQTPVEPEWGLRSRNAMDFCVDVAAPDETCLQNAIADDTVVVLPPGRYEFKRPVVVSGLHDVVIEGGGQRQTTLLGQGTIFRCDHCTGVSLKNFSFGSTVAPTVVKPSSLPTPDPSEQVVLDRWNSGHGYIPTVNDTDVWKLLSPVQKQENFDAYIVFADAEGIRVSGVAGLYGSVICYGCSYSRFDHNILVGGKNFAGGICLWRAFAGQAGSEYDLVDHNVLRYTGFSGIFVGGGDHVVVSDNVVEHAGESGIKTGQGSGEGSVFVSVFGNRVRGSWYDGLDLAADSPHRGGFLSMSTAVDNVSEGNRATGLTVDGRGWVIEGNTFSRNGAPGMLLDLTYSLVAFNRLEDNNLDLDPNQNQLTLGGSVAPEGDRLIGNEIANNADAPGYAVYVGGPGAILRENRAVGGGFWTVGRSVLAGNYVNGRLIDSVP